MVRKKFHNNTCRSIDLWLLYSGVLPFHFFAITKWFICYHWLWNTYFTDDNGNVTIDSPLYPFFTRMLLTLSEYKWFLRIDLITVWLFCRYIPVAIAMIGWIKICYEVHTRAKCMCLLYVTCVAKSLDIYY